MLQLAKYQLLSLISYIYYRHLLLSLIENELKDNISSDTSTVQSEFEMSIRVLKDYSYP